MKHVIDAAPGSTEFRQRFARIKDQFMQRFSLHTAGLRLVRYRAHGCNGESIRWVRSQGTAEQFISGMFNDGFCVAYRGVKSLIGVTVLIRAWQEPITDPGFPESRTVLFEERHDGVFFDGSTTSGLSG